ncbi:MAG: hypothetical protein IJ841_03055 [Prevotella sp.]|nr:hypothetical protein [Prevotella sp.]
MWKNKLFDDITKLVQQHRLGKALYQLESYLLANAHQTELSELLTLKDDYQLMADYWRKGFDDPKREEVYLQLLRRLYVLTTNVAIHDRIRNTSFLLSAYSRSRQARKNWSVATLQADLEGYVSEVALLQLEPEHVRQQKSQQLYATHQRMMNDLFDYIWTSRSWRDSMAGAFETILLSPTIDPIDQQLIVSAVMLSAMNAFDFNKFRVLTTVYAQAFDEQLRQRALVGWVLCAASSKASLYPEMPQIVARLCADERCRQELTELQLQLVYCAQADADSQKIRDEIMPELIRNENIKVTQRGIVEMDDDKMEDILHPDAAEQRLERVEENMRKMADMLKQGSDIYFAGFSQMKRFPFFNDVANWFVPFYPQHPGVSSIWEGVKAKKFLKMITGVAAFCDSDKYSFVLAFDQVVSRLPQQMLEMVEQGEAHPVPVGGEVPIEVQQRPDFLRRLYLQNLFRFFRLFPYRSEFVTPFGPRPCIFFANSLFRGTELEQRMPEVASFLAKRKQFEAAKNVLSNVSSKHHDYQYLMLKAHVLMHQDVGDGAELITMNRVAELYDRALRLQPGDARATKGHARALMACHRYEEAFEDYEQLLTQPTVNRSTELNAAVCLVNMKRYEEALKLLYKLNYEQPDEPQSNRVLAWTLAVSGKYEQAQKLYDKLLSASKPQPADMLNYGYCLWFKGDVVSAVSMMRQYKDQQKEAAIGEELLHTEYQLIRDHGISDADIHLMLDYLGE